MTSGVILCNSMPIYPWIFLLKRSALDCTVSESEDYILEQVYDGHSMDLGFDCVI